MLPGSSLFLAIIVAWQIEHTRADACKYSLDSDNFSRKDGRSERIETVRGHIDKVARFFSLGENRLTGSLD